MTSSNFYLYRVHILIQFLRKPVYGVANWPANKSDQVETVMRSVREIRSSQPESKWFAQIKHRNGQFVVGSDL